MAIEFKYGRVTLENSTIGEDEPVVVFRAQDRLLPAVLGYYAELCADKGSPGSHVRRIHETRRKIWDWQAQHPTIVKVPD